jgi:hypothetical protein
MKIITLRVSSLAEANKCSVPDGFEKINVMSWHKKDTEYFELSPYYLRTDGKEELKNPGNIIFENFWQSSKVYPIVYPQKVYPHRALVGKPNFLLWEWKNEEKHFINNVIQPEYYVWRDSINSCQKAIRYPNGFHGRTTVAFSLLNEKRLGYLDARKEIYVKEYSRLVRSKNIYKKLLTCKNICIIEVDLPCYAKKGIWHTNESNVYELNLEKVNNLLESTENAFGHGLVLAKCLFEDS